MIKIQEAKQKAQNLLANGKWRSNLKGEINEQREHKTCLVGDLIRYKVGIKDVGPALQPVDLYKLGWFVKAYYTMNNRFSNPATRLLTLEGKLISCGGRVERLDEEGLTDDKLQLLIESAQYAEGVSLLENRVIKYKKKKKEEKKEFATKMSVLPFKLSASGPRKKWTKKEIETLIAIHQEDVAAGKGLRSKSAMTEALNERGYDRTVSAVSTMLTKLSKMTREEFDEKYS